MTFLSPNMRSLGVSNVVIDTESSIFSKGSAFARRNSLCYLGAYPERGAISTYLANQLPDFQREVDAATLLVGFHITHDLHWLRRVGIGFEGKRVWDCQVAHFLLQAQRTPYPSLDGVAKFYGIEGKLGTAADYWTRGIDTPDIPQEVMIEYNGRDLSVTMEIFKRQRKTFEEGSGQRYNLFKLDMQDLLVLEEMEWNGLKFNVEKSLIEEAKASGRIAEIEQLLANRCPNTPVNWDSVDCVSAYLYGGTITTSHKEPAGLFRTGAKTGEVRYRWVDTSYPLERLVEPLEGSQLKKDGVWGTSEDVLKQLPKRPEIALLLERAKLTKLRDYLRGFPELIAEKDWPPNQLHGQFNQVVARTGRLSSSSPNLQNMPEAVLALVETRYE